MDATEGRRLLDGNVLDTEKESRAWVLLDDDRAVTVTRSVYVWKVHAYTERFTMEKYV